MKQETYLKLKSQKRKAKLLGLLTVLSLFGCKNKENIKTYDNETKKEQILELILEKTITTETSNITSNKENYTTDNLLYINPPYIIDAYSNKNNTLIAHRGYKKKENTKEAFIYAGEKGFWGAEADVRFDKNGNLVCSHESVNKGDNPTTFEEYLTICREFGMIAIIDLKYENGSDVFDENLSPNVLNTINKMKMIDKCVIQTNNSLDIPYIRKNSKNARIWYLTNDLSDKNIQLIKDNNVECVNLKANDYSIVQINKLNEIGVNSCVWNVFTLNVKERLLNNGATYIMSDNALDISKDFENNNLNNNNIQIEIVSPPNVIEFEYLFNNNTLRK